MTKQEQIEEIQKIIDDSWEFSSISAELGSGDGDINVEEAAKALYNAGYRKIDDLKAEREMLGSQIKVLKQRLNDKYIEIDNLNRDYSNAFERLKSQQQEIERLKAENETYCKQINQAYDTGYDDGYESCQDDIKKADELLKEYEK